MPQPRNASVPVRTCVGCRSRAAQSELLRLAVVGGAVVPDPRRRVSGRGAYLHPRARCRELAERRKAWQRAFRTGGKLDSGPVAAALQGGDAVNAVVGSG